jgi:hypothetical protein
LHIQDGALFYPKRLHLSVSEADQRCQALVGHARGFGGVVTVLWHDRSHGPERFWGDFYKKLLQSLRAPDVWFSTAIGMVNWFSKRRTARFQSSEMTDGSTQVTVQGDGEKIVPSLNIRVYRPNRDFMDVSWDGETSIEFRTDCTQVRTAN